MNETDLLSVRVDKDLKTQFKAVCIQNGVSMRAAIEFMMRKAVDKAVRDAREAAQREGAEDDTK
jgi:antitoxin component of RelBE/YafQ-DinJ toxin-antitoxin module